MIALIIAQTIDGFDVETRMSQPGRTGLIQVNREVNRDVTRDVKHGIARHCGRPRSARA